MAITKDDIQFSIRGFVVHKITKATNAKLSKIENVLTEKIASVHWSNIDDLGCLSVSWLHSRWSDDEEREKIAQILSKLFPK